MSEIKREKKRETGRTHTKGILETHVIIIHEVKEKKKRERERIECCEGSGSETMKKKRQNS